MKTISLAALSLALVLNLPAQAFDGDYELGMFELNRGEFKAAIAQFTPLLEEEYAPAQYQMGQIYLNGYGVSKDPQKAVELITKAAMQNYPEALFNLSVMHSEGTLVQKDLKAAFEYMKKAADKNLPSAQFNLGVMYANGEGVPKDSYRAVRWYEKAARQNYPLAQFNLALMYFEGNGVKPSVIESYIWNTIAAKSGYEPAIKSRDMDERKLSIEDIKEARAAAEKRYQQILVQVDLRTKMLSENSF
ncbi:tetratricopeptide repeat protein [Thalassotalea ganghwensis]